MTLARRRVLKFAMASTALATLSACGAGNLGGMAGGLMGGGGGKSWGEIAKSFKNLMNQAVDGVAETQESIAMLAEARQKEACHSAARQRTSEKAAHHLPHLIWMSL